MHVRIAWEIYNHQHKNADPNKTQPSSLNPSPSLRDTGSRILNNELTKKPTVASNPASEADKSKFAPPVISRTMAAPMDRQNPFGVDQRISSAPKNPMTSLGKDFWSNTHSTEFHIHQKVTAKV